jgi:phosphoglycolate phosphatase
MPKLLGIVFDLDGTLIDSAPDLRHAINATLRDFGRAEITLDTLKSFVGDGMLMMLERAFAATGAPLKDGDSYKHFQTFIEHYRRQKGDPAQIYPQARDMLERMKKSGIKLGLCTNKQEEATRRLLNDIDLARYFDAIAGGDTYMVHKPHPDHLLNVIKEMNVPSQNVLMIGDSSRDVQAAKAAGVPSIVVTHGYSTDWHELGADALIDGFSELDETLARLGWRYI